MASGPGNQARSFTLFNDTSLLIGLGCAALLIVWLVFGLVKKVLGLALLAAVFGAGLMLWNNPGLLHQLLGAAAAFMGSN
ncbi:MAG: hypothetical protein JWP99_582 [Devosia sp.]|nr:hypothetical protein [Devosia sp.]